MSKFKLGSLVLGFVFMSTPALASWSKSVCKNGPSERLVETVYPAQGKKLPCQVKYTKGTDSKVIYSSDHEEGFCDKHHQEFLEKLTGMGYTCKEGT